ncbi:multidrug effflux MFS transporter [Bacillus sonorensis]|uniref:multidrug effflux MFS transporter n=1 Tax=Bacillus sonorensis TaxID=119858 RepID=UPI001F1AD4C1|nr:multidrug effflux MFS transporter [Bacillus sonorensis]MCF7616092.1 multidrug effflux MFS transporter [Bacillus sonorensis]MCY7857981.1 multidrug effflux MFS transporter [Bacillus sonorensis]MCZ0068235.1 multidrug effflux MFS transporter [Bacillus sonorensis]MCZ0094630.1 multidrug effflux MFS transporter [Bacillus sonorensis]MEC1519328.1 multidrug effflux MFS transporter [Bacillus sonorensis]
MGTVNSQADLAAQSKAKPNRIWIAVILGILSGIGPVVIDLYLPGLPQMADDLHTSASIVQLSLTSCLLGLAIGQIVIGPFSDVLGRRIPLIVSLAVFAAASFLCALTSSVWVLIAMRFIQGAAGAGGIVISRAIARDLYSGTELTKFFSLLMLVNGIAPIVSPVAGGQLMKVTTWNGVFFMIGVFGIIIILSVIIGIRESLSPDNRTRGGFKETFVSFGRLFGQRTFMGYALAQGLITAGMFGYISASPFVLQDIYGLSAQAFSFCFAVNGLGIIIAAQITGRLAGRFGEAALLRCGLMISLAASLVLFVSVVFHAPLMFVLIPLFIVVSCIGIVTTSSGSLAMQSQGKSAGSASALLGLLTFILGAGAAPLVGIAGSHTALPMAVVIVCCNIGALVCFKMLVGRRASK